MKPYNLINVNSTNQAQVCMLAIKYFIRCENGLYKNLGKKNAEKVLIYDKYGQDHFVLCWQTKRHLVADYIKNLHEERMKSKVRALGSRVDKLVAS